MKKAIIILCAVVTVVFVEFACKNANKKTPTNKVQEQTIAETIFDGDRKPLSSPNIELNAKNPEDLIRSDETVFGKIFGDLNSDGDEDCVIITKQTKKDMIVEDGKDRNRRGLLIAFREKGEHYKTALAIPDCFSSENEDGGVYFPPELSLQIRRGNLIIHYAHGRYGWWQYVFRYRNNVFELIGYDVVEMFGPVLRKSESINFLTKKKQTKTNTNLDGDEDDEIIEEIWECINIDKLVRLPDIKDFDDFFISKFYSVTECK